MSRDSYANDLDDLDRRVREMLALARNMFEDGMAAFLDLDAEKAAKVSALREPLAEFDEELEQEALEILTLQSPMAGDLRRVAANLKLITYINRIGRYGRDIANETTRWPAGRGHDVTVNLLREMADHAMDMVRIFQEAFENHSHPSMDRILELENTVDQLRRRVWDECLKEMRKDSEDIEICPHYMVVARYLERVGDHVCKMTEKSVYASTGHHVTVK